MTGRGTFRLTRRAALDLKAIHRRSADEWGDEVATRYMADLYASMSRAASDPETGRLRAHRAVPFLMVAARKHFIVFDRLGDGIVIVTVLHQARDVERIVAGLSRSFVSEIESLKSRRS